MPKIKTWDELLASSIRLKAKDIPGLVESGEIVACIQPDTEPGHSGLYLWRATRFVQDLQEYPTGPNVIEQSGTVVHPSESDTGLPTGELYGTTSQFRSAIGLGLVDSDKGGAAEVCVRFADLDKVEYIIGIAPSGDVERQRYRNWLFSNPR